MSTRRVDDLIKALGCDGISSSQVSRICEQLDEVVESFLGRPLDGGPYPYVWLDGLTQKVREGGRIVNVCVVVATGVNAEGQREILGMDVGASEDGAFWLAFLRSLTARGLSGVELVTSEGLSLGFRTRAASAMKPRHCEYSRKPLVKRGCSGSGPATAGGQWSMTRYLGTPPKQTHAASSPAMMSSSVCPWVGQTKLCRE